MTNITRLLLAIVIATYFGFFVIEAVAWTIPWVHDLLIPQLNPDLDYPSDAQAAILRALFVNQGVYNLLLGLGGLYGLQLWKHGNLNAARPLLWFLCLFAIGAALTLLASTQAYLLGIVQLIFPAAALLQIERDARRLYLDRLLQQHRPPAETRNTSGEDR